MLFRRVAYPIQNLLKKNLCLFSQNTPAQDNNHKDEEQIMKTKHNPLGLKELRGYENLHKLNQTEIASNNLLSKQVSKTSASYLCSFLPNNIAKRLNSTYSYETHIASDQLHFPKIYPNGVPVYDSINGFQTEIITAKLIAIASPAIILLNSTNVGLNLLFYSIGLWIYYVLSWASYSHSIVLKLELLPSTQEIVYQNINRFGMVATKKVKISDLEFFSLSQQRYNSYSARAVRGFINMNTCFRNKQTGEQLFFDKNGIWHEEGISHQLLV